MIQQVDGANTTPYERPGRIEEVEGEAEVEKDDGGWVLVETQRKTRERGKVVQEEKKTEVERECRGGRDPVEALRKTWGNAVADMRQDRTGSLRRRYPVLAYMYGASGLAEIAADYSQEEMDKQEAKAGQYG